MSAPKKKTSCRNVTFLAADWADVYDALLDAAEAHHSGPRADRILALARKIREELIS